MVIVHTAIFILKFSTHYEHSAFYKFCAGNRKGKAIIIILNIWFTILKEGIHCGVRSEYLDIIQIKLRSMAVISHSGRQIR